MKKFLILSFLSSNLWASCPIPPSKGVPECPPAGQHTQLDERYPEQAFVVSTAPYNATSRSRQMPMRFIEGVVRSHGTNIDAIPNFIIPTTNAEFISLREALRASLTRQYPRNPALVNNVISKLVYAEAQPWTWQQDYFESFFDPATGRPVVREVSAYQSRIDSAAAVDALGEGSNNACRTIEGRPLQNIGALNSQMGGNIESLPGGLCMVGNNQDRLYTQQFCPADSIVNVRTDWLSVGHADEIVKVIPNNTKSAPCNFSIMFASPRKALELLNRNRDERFFDLSIYQGDQQAMTEARRSRRESFLYEFYEQTIWPIRQQRQQNQSPSTPAKTIDSGAMILNFVSANAYANSREDYLVSDMMNITNGEMYDAIQSDMELRDYNQLVQNEMDRIKRDVIARISQRLPACRNNISTIDVPNLFEGSPVVRSRDGRMQLPVPGFGNALLPNPTNGILTNQTMIFPQQFNGAFNGYLRSETSRATGLQIDFLDTWDYAHRGSGNLHCSTHALRYCTPISAR